MWISRGRLLGLLTCGVGCDRKLWMRGKSSRGVGLRHYVSKLDRDGTSRIRVGPSALIERGGRLGEMGHKNL